MSFIGKALGRTTVATGVATVVLASAVGPDRPSMAAPQQPVIVVRTTQERVEVKKAEAQVGKAVDVLIQKQAVAIDARNPAVIDQNTLGQLSPIFRLELRTLTSVAAPTPAQRREIAIEAGRGVKELARNLAAINNGNRPVGRAVSARSDPRKLIHDSVAAAAKSKLTPEQFIRFQAESEQKTQDRREVVLLNIVAKIDQLLILSPDQRGKLQESLRAQWDDRIYPQIEMLVTYDAYFPAIPDAQIRPILTDAQRKVWQDVQKINFGTIRMANGFNNAAFQANPPGDEDADVKAALADEVKP